MEQQINKIRSGFTLIELILVTAVFVIIISASVPVLASYLSRNQTQTQGWKLTDTLNRARIQSLTGRGNQDWGVHFDVTQYVLFQGSIYSALDSDNENHTLPSSIIINTVSLNGGGNDIIFNLREGDTDEYGSITIKNTSSSQIKTIEVNEVGRINNP